MIFQDILEVIVPLENVDEIFQSPNYYSHLSTFLDVILNQPHLPSEIINC